MERHKLIPAVHLFMINDGKILLLKRQNTGFEDGNYGVPAGHLDGEETVRQAMIREAWEEARVRIKPENLKMAHIMNRMSDTERLDFFFTADIWEGQPEIGEPEKCSELAWYEISDMPANLIPYIRESLLNIYKNEIYSEFGWNKKQDQNQ